MSFLRAHLQRKLDGIFKAAARINPEVAPKGPAAFFDSSVDVSPEATADRIVGFALGLFGVFQKQHPEMDDAELAAAFASEVRRGIEDGFARARHILDGLGVLNGQVIANVDRTYELVHQKLDTALAQLA